MSDPTKDSPIRTGTRTYPISSFTGKLADVVVGVVPFLVADRFRSTNAR